MRLRLFLPPLLLLLPLAAAAQQDERLPDLTPREFEIRGELQVSLPDLQRQPLRGFVPPPRTYVVPANRQSFVGTYGQSVDDLPENPLAAPAAPSIVRSQPRTGQIDLLAGRYLARRGRLTLNATNLGLDVSYAGFSDYGAMPDGPAPPPGTDAPSIGADDLRGQVTLTGGDALRYQMAVDGALHRYELLSAYLRSGGTTDPKRNVRSLGATMSFEGVGNGALPFSLRARLENTNLRDALNASGPIVDPIFDEPTLEQSETRLALSGTLDTRGLYLDASAALATLGEDAFFSSYSSYSAGGAVDVAFGEARLRVGARAFGYGASEENGDGSSFQVAPILDLEAPIAPGFRFFVRNRPGVRDRGLATLAGENPYAVPGAVLAPDLFLLDAEVGVEVQFTGFRLNAFGGYRYAPTHLYFSRSAAPLSPWDGSPGLYRAQYAKVAMPRGGADLTFYAPGNISFSVGGEVRAPRLPDEDRGVPYLASFLGRASVAVPFAGARGLVQAALEAEGPRPTLFDEDAPAWADLSVEAHYRFAGRFGLLARADHLAGRAERWPGFPQPPFVITAGVRAGW